MMICFQKPATILVERLLTHLSMDFLFAFCFMCIGFIFFGTANKVPLMIIRFYRVVQQYQFATSQHP